MDDLRDLQGGLRGEAKPPCEKQAIFTLAECACALNLLLTGVDSDDLNNKGTQLAILGSLASTLDVDPTCLAVTNPELQSVKLQEVSVDSQLGVSISCKTAGTPFTSDLDLLSVPISGFLPSPGISSVLITTLQNAGLPQMLKQFKLAAPRLHHRRPHHPHLLQSSAFKIQL